jgi:hypothetical protein
MDDRRQREEHGNVDDLEVEDLDLDETQTDAVKGGAGGVATSNLRRTRR